MTSAICNVFVCDCDESSGTHTAFCGSQRRMVECGPPSASIDTIGTIAINVQQTNEMAQPRSVNVIVFVVDVINCILHLLLLRRANECHIQSVQDSYSVFFRWCCCCISTIFIIGPHRRRDPNTKSDKPHMLLSDATHSMHK